MFKWFYHTENSNRVDDNLLQLLQGLESRIDKLEKSKGGSYKTVKTKSQTKIRAEYVEYMKLYGPPLDGVWDEEILARLRQQLISEGGPCKNTS